MNVFIDTYIYIITFFIPLSLAPLFFYPLTFSYFEAELSNIYEIENHVITIPKTSTFSSEVFSDLFVLSLKAGTGGE